MVDEMLQTFLIVKAQVEHLRQLGADGSSSASVTVHEFGHIESAILDAFNDFYYKKVQEGNYNFGHSS